MVYNMEGYFWNWLVKVHFVSLLFFVLKCVGLSMVGSVFLSVHCVGLYQIDCQEQ